MKQGKKKQLKLVFAFKKKRLKVKLMTMTKRKPAHLKILKERRMMSRAPKIPMMKKMNLILKKEIP